MHRPHLCIVLNLITLKNKIGDLRKGGGMNGSVAALATSRFN